MNGDPRYRLPQGAGLEDDASQTPSNEASDAYAWVPWFCALSGHEFFAQVDQSFMQDGFNLTGLNNQVTYFHKALDTIMDAEVQEQITDEQQDIIDNDAENLYGLVHARFILTTRGLSAMYEKYRHGDFGRCPRVYCGGQHTLPVGLSDTTNQECVKLYCPSCEEVYVPRSKRYENIDGAYFGTTFAHLFLLTYPELKPTKKPEKYVPRVFGFRVNKNAYAHSLEYNQKAKKAEKGG